MVSQHHNPPDHARHAFAAFDTLVVLDLWGDPAECETATATIEALCREYEHLLSRTIPMSDIGRINASAGHWISVDRRTFDLLEAALGYCERSNGLFDITVAPLVELWDFKRGIVPAEDDLRRAAAHVDWRKIELDEAHIRVRLGDPRAKIDLGGIAKGWIADEIRVELMDGPNGICGMIANLGGNIVVAGQKPDGGPWRIGVKDPCDPVTHLATIPIESGSVVTSGIYERALEQDGQNFHHILDPQTGWPANTDLASATLVCDHSLDAEGYSTTVLALGKEAAMRFVQEHPVIKHACLVTLDGELILHSALP